MLMIDDAKGRVAAAAVSDPVALGLRPPQAARERLHALLPGRHQTDFAGKQPCPIG